MQVTITFADGTPPLEVRTSARDVVNMERRFKMKATDGNPSYEQSLFMVYRAALRTDGFPADEKFDAFIDRVEDFEKAEDETDEDADGGTAATPTED